jgi:hypothetical protein
MRLLRSARGHDDIRLVEARAEEWVILRRQWKICAVVGNPIAASLLDPPTQRDAVVFVSRVAQQANPWLLDRVRCGDFGRPVTAPVIDHDDLEVPAAPLERGNRSIERGSEVLLLVEHRKN